MKHYADFTIIGGGIVGAATAFTLQKTYPEAKIIVLEKEAHSAFHQTGRNSGVLHSGLYYKPGSYRAKNCVEGREALVEFAYEQKIPHEVCGKIVAARNSVEAEKLPGLKKRGEANGLSGIHVLNEKETQEIEPHVRAEASLFVPQTGIIDFKAATQKMLDLMLEINPKSEVLFNAKVLSIQTGKQKTIRTQKLEVETKYLISCGGLFSDRLAHLDGLDPALRIVGFRGDYYELTKAAKHKIRNLVYPVPNPEFPFLGVHFTRMTDGSIECGPNAVFTFKREGYGKLDFNLKDSLDALLYAGTRKLFQKHWRFGLNEYQRAFSKTRFLNELQGLLPSLRKYEILPGRSGVRAMALHPSGEICDDFVFEMGDRSIHVLNAPSPAATACLAIAEEIVKRVKTDVL